MEVSFEDGDNFIRNAVTIKCAGGPYQAPMARKLEVADGLPVSVEDLMLDLRVDSPDGSDSLERMQRGACDFLERRTGHVLIPGRYQVDLPGWWSGPLQIMRGPLRDLQGISYLSAANTYTAADMDGFHVDEEDNSFIVQPLSTFTRPDLWSEIRRVRLSFQAGYRTPDETGSAIGPDMPDGLRTILIMTVGHYWKNVELFQAGKLEQLNVGAMAFLGTYRQFW